jgi:hypothetical protein
MNPIEQLWLIVFGPLLVMAFCRWLKKRLTRKRKVRYPALRRKAYVSRQVWERETHGPN